LSEEKTAKYLVFNHRDQPVELHCGHRVVVLPPQGQAELDEAEQASPQVQVLRQRRSVTVRPVVVAPPAKPSRRKRRRGK
jgi:hypothetical protein